MVGAGSIARGRFIRSSARRPCWETLTIVLNTWWDGDATQGYWMEVATTGAMGEILIAPKFPGATWSYNLVGEVRRGDRVLNWRATSEGRALVG